MLVTFIYTHCPDICPTIVGNLHTTQSLLGTKARRLQVIAVSVDPRGDTPKAVSTFLSEHQMTDGMEYLVGTRRQLEKVWSDWGVVSKNAEGKSDPDLVEHSAPIFGISASGMLSSIYPANFRPRRIVHDVPILAAR